ADQSKPTLAARSCSFSASVNAGKLLCTEPRNPLLKSSVMPRRDRRSARSRFSACFRSWKRISCR
ncbi:hypothetical protein, partial [Rhizobium johnstonii]|uniref:hypothetical protein n=1 Tax=Rhizobium johnstonii TaxID=3019933 RepID=UPI003F9846F6